MPVIVKKAEELTPEDFSWLPAKRTCDCKDERLNCLERKDWAKYGSTILAVTKRHKWHESYPARFIPELPERYIQMFSHKGQAVLDPFMGTGTVNVVAEQFERNSVGIDVEPDAVEIASKRLSNMGPTKMKHLIIQGDSNEALTLIPPNSIDLIVSSPPYWVMQRYPHEHERQLGHIQEYADFLKEITPIFEKCHAVLKPRGYFVLNTQDFYCKQTKAAIHVDYVNILKKIGFELWNMNIYILYWSTGGRLVFGYPREYYPKTDWEAVLILRKS